ALIEQAHDEAYQVLTANRDILDQLALELLEKETLDHHRLDEIFAPVRKLPRRPQWLSSSERPVSELPPVGVPRRADDRAPVAANTAQPQQGDAATQPGTGTTRPATA